MHKIRRASLVGLALAALGGIGYVVYNAQQPTPADRLEASIESYHGALDVLTIGTGENEMGTVALMVVACAPREECMDVPASIEYAVMVEGINTLIEILPGQDYYLLLFGGYSEANDAWVAAAGLRCPPREGGYAGIAEIQRGCELARFPSLIILPSNMLDRINP